MDKIPNKEKLIAQIEVNPNLHETPNYSVPNPGSGSPGEILAIIMAMTIFGGVVKKLIA